MLILNKIILLLFTALFAAHLSAQQRQLDFIVYRGEDAVGKLRAIKITDQNKTTCSLYSDVKVNSIIQVNVIENIKNVFMDNLLFSSSLKRLVNGRLKVDNAVTKNKNAYHLRQKDNETNIIYNLIGKCVLSLYFEEPLLFHDVYSENFQEVLKILKVAEHKYLLKLPNGNKAYYTYKAGQLAEVEAHTTWTLLRFVRIV